MNIETPEGIWDGIEACPVHVTELSEDCGGCKAEVAARGARIEQMQAEASERVAGLARQGIDFPGMALDHLKVQIMWENIFQGRAAYQAEGELGRRALLMIKDMQRQVTEQTIAKPNGAGGLTVVRNKP